MRRFIFILIASLVCPALTHAAEVIFDIVARVKPPQLAVSGDSPRAVYSVTNNTGFSLLNNGVVNLPFGVTQITNEAGSCGLSFDLNPGGKCNLILNINMSLMPLGINWGPKICHSLSHPVYCSLPSPSDFLSIRKSPEIDAILEKPIYKNSIWGMRVIDSNTGEILVDFNSNYNFFVGSVRKLFSIGEYLLQVGEHFRFRTPVSYQGVIDNNGVLHGDLILTASGDITMGGRNLPNNTIAYTDPDHSIAQAAGTAVLTTPNPLAGYNYLAQQVYNFGIREVTGEVIIDDRLFVPFNFNGEYDVSAIFVNDDLVDVSMTPSSLGTPAIVDTRPVSAAFTVNSTLMTSGPGTEPTYTLNPFLPACIGTTPCIGTVSGNLPIDFIPPITNAFPLVQTFRIVQPANYARTVFIESLVASGVVINAAPVAQNPVPPAGVYMPVTELVSLPFSQFAKFVLKTSYNVGSDTIFVLFGLTQGVNNMADALVVERNMLVNQYGIPGDQFLFVNGSGSGDTLATNNAVVKWLQIMRQPLTFPAFFHALPIMGVDGTLSAVKDFQADPSLIGATGQVYAKTGTYAVGQVLKGQAYAGYINARSGRQLTYHVVVNNVPVNSIAELFNIFQDQGTISAILWRDF